MHNLSYHSFESEDEVTQLQKSLMTWFHSEKRDLPWRKPFEANPDPIAQGQRAYEVWVSEIMSQQTRISTVIEYYNKWMTMWPTMEALSKASLDDIHKVWSGLGYYSRGTRMLEAAKIVMDNYKGRLPDDPVVLEKNIPGVGRYTAGAIASQAYNKPAPLVDGNVIRVLSRSRALGLDPKSKRAVELHWALAERVLLKSDPGDFNQAMMELGARVCTPQNPSCGTCPIQAQCRAYSESTNALKGGPFNKSKKRVLENVNPSAQCELCLPLGDETDIEDCSSFMVTRYPAAIKKKAPEEKEVLVVIVEIESTSDSLPSKYLVHKRPEKGLLANLWDFPHIPLSESLSMETLRSEDILFKQLPLGGPHPIKKRKSLGSVLHLFSHIRLTMNVEWVVIAGAVDGFSVGGGEWWAEAELDTGAVPVTLKKAFKLLVDSKSNVSGRQRKKAKVEKSQPTISNFFKPKE
ncbi:DNA glycosylase [Obelidium mucronatum]|nr:DNA glycosylase [Obelidium mucronatum]